MSCEACTCSQLWAWASVRRRSVPTTWLNIGPRSAPGSFGSCTLAPRRVWQTAKPPVMAVVVIQISIPNLLTSGRPVVLGEVVADEVARDAEVAADGLPDTQPVQRPRERIRDGVGDGAVPLVAAVERRHEVKATLEDGPGQQFDPFRHDRPQVRVDHDQRLARQAHPRPRRWSGVRRPCHRLRRSRDT